MNHLLTQLFPIDLTPKFDPQAIGSLVVAWYAVAYSGVRQR